MATKKPADRLDEALALSKIAKQTLQDIPSYSTMKSPEALFVIGVDPGAGKSPEAHCLFLITLNAVYILGGNIMDPRADSVVPYQHALCLYRLILKCHALNANLGVLIVIEANWGFGVPFYQCMTALIAKLQGKTIAQSVYFNAIPPKASLEKVATKTKGYGMYVDRYGKYESLKHVQYICRNGESEKGKGKQAVVFRRIDIDGLCQLDGTTTTLKALEQYHLQQIYTYPGKKCYTGIDKADKDVHHDDMYMTFANTVTFVIDFMTHYPILSSRKQYMHTLKTKEREIRTQIEQNIEFLDEMDYVDNTFDGDEMPQSMPQHTVYTSAEHTACIAYCSLFYACSKIFDAYTVYLNRCILNSLAVGYTCPHGYQIVAQQHNRACVSWKRCYDKIMRFYNVSLACATKQYVNIRFTGLDGKMWLPVPRAATATEPQDILHYMMEMFKLSKYLGQTHAVHHPILRDNRDRFYSMCDILNDVLNKYITILNVYPWVFSSVPSLQGIHDQLQQCDTQAQGRRTIPITVMQLWYDATHHRRAIRAVYRSHRRNLISACTSQMPANMDINTDQNPLRANIRFSIGNRLPYKEIVTRVLGLDVVQQIINLKKEQQQLSVTDSSRIRYTIRRTCF